MPSSAVSEQERVSSLLDAQDKAIALFDALSRAISSPPGASESAVSDAIRDLADEMFGTRRFWHKRIVRTGINTLEPYRSNPPDLTIAADDITFLDFGPIFEAWEADFGRTYVLGDDPAKIALRDALEPVWQRGGDYFHAHPDVTGAELYAHVVDLARQSGWEFGSSIAGHLVGEFPHEKIAGHKTDSYIKLGSVGPMRRLDAAGRPCHWILEIHLVDRARGIGGFFEQLLDLSR